MTNTIIEPVVFEGFENSANWSVSVGSINDDTSKVQSGNQSIKMITGSGTACDITKIINSDLSRSGVISLNIYAPTLDGISDLRILISSSTSFAKYFQIIVQGLHEGWNHILVGRNEWTNVSSEDWSNTMVRLRLRLNAAASSVGTLYVDNLTVSGYSRPKCIISFDDIFASVHTLAFPYMQLKGIRGVVYLAEGKCNSSPSYANNSQISELHTAGWDIGNHTETHAALGTLTLSQQQTEISNCRDWIISQGWTNNAAYRHVAYPGGSYDANTEASLLNTGSITGRTIFDRTQAHELDAFWLRTRQALVHTTTLSQAKSYIDRTIASGGCIEINFHDIVTQGTASIAVEYGVDDFKAVIDYLLAKREQIDIITLTEWYRSLSSNRKLI